MIFTVLIPMQLRLKRGFWKFLEILAPLPRPKGKSINHLYLAVHNLIFDDTSRNVNELNKKDRFDKQPYICVPKGMEHLPF